MGVDPTIRYSDDRLCEIIASRPDTATPPYRIASRRADLSASLTGAMSELRRLLPMIVGPIGTVTLLACRVIRRGPASTVTIPAGSKLEDFAPLGPKSSRVIRYRILMRMSAKGRIARLRCNSTKRRNRRILDIGACACYRSGPTSSRFLCRTGVVAPFSFARRNSKGTSAVGWNLEQYWSPLPM